MTKQIKLSRDEHGQLLEIAEVENRDEVRNIIQRTRIVQGEDDISKIRSLAAQAIEVGVHERRGFDAIEDLYERASAELYQID